MSAPVQSGSIGELFWRVNEAVVLVDGDQLIALNPAAERLFGVQFAGPAPAKDVLGDVLGPSYDDLGALIRQPGTATIDATGSCGLVLDVKSWPIEGSDIRMLIVSDVSASRRLSDGLARLSALGRELLTAEPELPDLLQQLVDEAKHITQADYSALLLIHPDHQGGISHFVYNAPRELFPDQLPRTVGLLAVPLTQRAAVVVDDIRGHPDAVGIPVNHPPIGPLLATPLFSGDAVVGEIAVANAPDSRRFDDIDMQLMNDLGAHAGIAVRWTESRERARLAGELRREIIATARHDIRNPLTIGRGYASILEQKRDRMTEEQVQAALAAVQHAFERIEQFASRALLTEEDAADVENPSWEQVGVAPLLQSLADDHTAAARDVGTRVVTKCEPATPPSFVGDGGMVREILDNLVTNAIKYGARGGVITVTSRPEGDSVRFDVHNDGEGIAPDDQQRIFDRYWRTDGARHGDIPGTGLGLAIVRRLVDVHSGVVGVASRPDEGTTFWVTFPVERDQDGNA